jgi:hypothetical protein
MERGTIRVVRCVGILVRAEWRHGGTFGAYGSRGRREHVGGVDSFFVVRAMGPGYGGG